MSVAILNSKTPCVSMPVTLYEAVCHRRENNDKQSCCLVFTPPRSVKALCIHFPWMREEKVGPTKSKQMGEVAQWLECVHVLFPVGMYWLHLKNFKQLMVSPLRPLFLSVGLQRQLRSIKGVLLLKVHGCVCLCCANEAYRKTEVVARRELKRQLWWLSDHK